MTENVKISVADPVLFYPLDPGSVMNFLRIPVLLDYD
jgi:hypothetical protein